MPLNTITNWTRSERRKADRRKSSETSSFCSDSKADCRRYERRGLPDFYKNALRVQTRVDELKLQGLYHYMRTLESSSSSHAIVEGKEVIMFASNNFLGLATHPKVIEAGIKALKEYGSGSGGSRLLCGTTKLHRQLEEKIASFKGTEDAVIFNAGYMAIMGTITALLKRGDAAIIDEFDHASIIDGCLLSGARPYTFKHNDMNSLEKTLIRASKANTKLVVVDGIFSMGGDIANLTDICRLAKEYGAKVMVDEAHATGCIGMTGRGVVEYFNLNRQIDIISGTFSKTLCAVGGFTACNKEIASYLRHFSNTFVFSASLPPSVCATIMAAIDVLLCEPERVTVLQRNANFLREGLKRLGFNTGKSKTQIIPLIIGNEEKMNKFVSVLFENGIMVSAIGRPAVKRNKARIRLCVMATHTEDDLNKTLSVFDKCKHLL